METDAVKEELLVAMLDHLPAMVAFWDADLRNRFANRAYVEWFGISPSEMYGMHIKHLLGPRLYEMNLPHIQRALAGEHEVFERVLVDAEGRTRTSQASYTPYIVDGVLKGFFALVVDITGRVDAETALLASTEEIVLRRERERVALSLNEVVIRRLYAASLELSAALQPGVLDVAQRIKAVLQGIDEAVRDLRSSIFELDRTIRARPASPVTHREGTGGGRVDL